MDPDRAVSLAVITHGHADHARRGHDTVVATPETLEIMRCRYGKNFCKHAVPLGLLETRTLGDVEITFYPAGHVLGSVQVQISYNGQRLGVSGDYKRGGGDPTCADYEAVPCDVFITEATFAYPLFLFPDPWSELNKLLRSTRLFPSRPHIVAAYSLGKAQRVIASLRKMGFAGRIFAHKTVTDMNAVYERFGIELGEALGAENYRWNDCVEVADVIVSPQGGNLSLGLPDEISPVLCSASGWNSVRKHGKSRGSELPMVLSDHCDWSGLKTSIRETGAGEVWVTHGPVDALNIWGKRSGLKVLDLKEVWYV